MSFNLHLFSLKNFNDEDEEDEEDALPKPTAIGRLGRAIEPGDRSKIFLLLLSCYCMVLLVYVA